MASVTVPTGRKWVGIGSVARTYMDTVSANVRFNGFQAVITAGNGAHTYVIPAGSYPNVRLDGGIEVMNVSGTSAPVTGRISIGWVVLEVDA